MKTEKEIRDKLAEIAVSPKPDVKDIGVKFGPEGDQNYLYKSEADYYAALGERDGWIFALNWMLKEEVK